MRLFSNRWKLFICLAIILLTGYITSQTVVAATDTQLGFGYASALTLGSRDLRAIIIQIINILLGFLGIIAVIIVMYGGFVYMTSEGDPSKVETAKKILINGAIGLGIILMSWGIVTFIFRLFGLTGDGGLGGGSGITISTGPRALGSGIIENHYPSRNQQDVARNTMIAVTFKETLDVTTICAADCLSAATDINFDNIKIFRNSDDEVGALPASEVKVNSTDQKTFIFKPVKYLGDATNKVWYTVRLKNGIKKADGTTNAFIGVINGIGYEWQFEVSSVVDTTPPQIESVIPFPDNNQDTYGSTAAAQATGSITVAQQPQVFKPVTISPVEKDLSAGTATEAKVSGTYNGTVSSGVAVRINNSTTANVSWDNAALAANNNTNAAITNGAIVLGSGLTFLLDPGFVGGNRWTFNVSPEVAADYLRVGSVNYVFVNSGTAANQIVVGANTSATAANISAKVEVQAGESLNALANNNTVTITVVKAGSFGNSLAIVVDGTRLTTGGFSGGQDAGTTQDCGTGVCDQPRNVVIQINFNEPVNPLMATGEVKISDGSTVGTALAADSFNNILVSAMLSATKNYIAGNWVISNQYKTLEFLSNDKCISGTNSCGDDVFCLPTNAANPAEITVEVTAASLKTCSGNADCLDNTFNTCSTVCKDTNGNSSPQAAISPAGIVDLANNSLDGNRDGQTSGPATVYDLNNIVASGGDSVKWSFWVNDKIDLTPPKIEEIVPALNTTLNLDDPIEVQFSKLMKSSSLKPDSGYADGKRHLTLIDNSVNPAGYSINSINIDDSSPLDGRPDKTRAFINHTTLIASTNYGAEVGEGVQDMYQNCYVPAIGPGSECASTSQSCCNGTATLSPDCS